MAQVIDTVCPESSAVVEYWSDTVVQVASLTRQSSHTVIAWSVSLSCVLVCVLAAGVAVCFKLKCCKCCRRTNKKVVLPERVELSELTTVEVAEHTVTLTQENSQKQQADDLEQPFEELKVAASKQALIDNNFTFSGVKKKRKK